VGAAQHLKHPRCVILPTNKFWATLEKNVKDILHETDKILPTGGPSFNPERPLRALRARRALSRDDHANISFREAAAVIVNAEASLVIVRATSRQHERSRNFSIRCWPTQNARC